MELLIILSTGIMNALCFLIGAKVGSTVSNGKEVQMPAIKTPLEAIREHQDTKEAKREQERLDTIIRNVEMYDGTSNHQEDVPR